MSERPYNYAVVYSFEARRESGTGRCFLARAAPLDTAEEIISAEKAILADSRDANGNEFKSVFITNVLELKAGLPPRSTGE